MLDGRGAVVVAAAAAAAAGVAAAAAVAAVDTVLADHCGLWIACISSLFALEVDGGTGHAPLGAVGGARGVFQPDKLDRSMKAGAVQVLYS